MTTQPQCLLCKKDITRKATLFLINPAGGYGRGELWICRDCLPQFDRPALREAYPDEFKTVPSTTDRGIHT